MKRRCYLCGCTKKERKLITILTYNEDNTYVCVGCYQVHRIRSLRRVNSH